MHQNNGIVYSRNGRRGYPSVESAYKDGIGHPNCKCEWSIYWDKSQLETQYLAETEPGEYVADQKKKATERELRKAENDLSMYQMIGNGEMVDKTMMKIERLKEKL